MAHNTYQYSVAGDSVVNGVHYTRIMRSGTVALWPMAGQPNPLCTGTATPYGPWLVALVRQQGRTLRAWNGEVDTLLHDFDLHVGDLVPISLTNSSDAIEVVAVDSMLMNGQWRRVYTLVNGWADQLVEGVGSNNGLLEPIAVVLECGYSLDCYGMAGAGYYPGPGPQCQLPDGLPELETPAMSMGPNPASDQLTISLAGDVGNGVLQLLDAQGRLVRSVTPVGRTWNWDVSDVPTGVYQLQLCSGTTKVTRALAVMH